MKQLVGLFQPADFTSECFDRTFAVIQTRLVAPKLESAENTADPTNSSAPALPHIKDVVKAPEKQPLEEPEKPSACVRDVKRKTGVLDPPTGSAQKG